MLKLVAILPFGLYRHAWLMTVFFFMLAGCRGEAGYKPIDLSQTIQVEQPGNLTPRTTTLRVAVAAMISPKETLVYYQALLDYIGTQLELPIQLIQRKTYGEINELFPKRQIDLAFICTGPYALGKEMFGFEALATPIVRNEPYYQSYLIVNKDSPYQKLGDLRGRVFAFTDPESNTGALIPNFWVVEMGEDPNQFFDRVTYTYSHDNSIMAVAKGLVDGAAVDGHKWEYYHLRNPYYTAMTRVIRKSAPFGSPPVVASVYLDEALKSKIRTLMYNMHKDAAGKQILDELLIDRFTEPQEHWYESVRHIHRQMRTRQSSVTRATQDS